MRLTVIDRIKLEFNSYVETTGQDPTELIISEDKYRELCRMMSAEAVKYFNVGKALENTRNLSAQVFPSYPFCDTNAPQSPI